MLMTLLDDIQRQLHVPKSIDSMTARGYSSAPHLHRRCQQTYAQSFIQRLHFLRMDRASIF